MLFKTIEDQYLQRAIQVGWPFFFKLMLQPYLCQGLMSMVRLLTGISKKKLLQKTIVAY